MPGGFDPAAQRRQAELLRRKRQQPRRVPLVPTARPRQVSPVFGGPLVNPITTAQHAAAQRTQRAVQRQPAPYAEPHVDYAAIKRHYDSLPVAQRSRFLMNLPASQATSRLVDLHESRAHAFHARELQKRRLQAVFGPQATFIGPLPPPKAGPPTPQRTPSFVSVLHKGRMVAAPPARDWRVDSAVKDLFSNSPRRQQRAVGVLQEARALPGVSARERRAYQQAYRRQLLNAAFKLQRTVEGATDRAGVDRSEFMRTAGKLSNSQLEHALHRPPVKLQTLGVNAESVGGLLQGVGNTFGLVTGAAGEVANLAIGAKKHGIVGNALADLLNYPAQAVPAAYMLGKGVVDSKTRKQVLQGLASGVIGHLAAGDVGGAKQAFQQHPLYSIAELRGAQAAVSRSIGAGARLAGAEWASTKRAPLALAGHQSDRLVALRRYSKDPVVKAGQVLYDKTLRAGPKVSVYGERVQSKMAPRSSRNRHGENRGLLRFADYAASRANSLERIAREEEARHARMAAPVREHRGGRVGQRLGEALDRTLLSQPAHGRGRIVPDRFYRPERDVVGLVLEQVVRSPETFVKDLRTERQRLENAYTKNEFSHPGERLANRQNAQLIDRVLNDPRALANAEGVFASARKLAPRFHELEQEAIRRGALDPAAAARSKLFSTAMAHQGAVYSNTPAHDRREQAEGAFQQAKDNFRNARDERVRQQRTYEDSLAGFGVARGRAQVLSRNVGGVKAENAARRLTVPTDIPHFQGGGHGVSQGARALRGSLEKLKAARLAELEAQRALRVAGDARRTARHGASQTQLHAPDGKPLSNEQILATLERQGGDPSLLAHLPHHLNDRGARAYHRVFGLSRPTVEGQHSRTGSLFGRGATTSDYTHVLETLVGRSTKLTNIREFDRLLSDVGIKRPDGKYFTPDEADAYLKNTARRDSHGRIDPNQPELVPMRAHNSRLRADQIKAIEEQQNVSRGGLDAHLLEQHFASRRDMSSDRGARNVVLVPKELAQRLEDHATRTAHSSATLQFAQGAFRRSVLPFSFKWMFGNVAEAVGRLGVAGAVPVLDSVGSRRLLKEMIDIDANAAKGFEAEMIGGQLWGRRGLTVNRGVREAFGAPGEAVARAPVVKELGQVITTATDVAFGVNRVLENEAQRHALGKFARQQIQELTGSWWKAITLQKKALRQVAEGLTKTPEQIQAARFADETLGKYSRMSPKLRNFIQTYAPFLPWYLNSARFVAHTLPAKHPVKMAVLTRTEAQFQQDYNESHKNIPPGSLKMGIPHKGGLIDLARYGPFGFLGAAVSDPKELTSFILPQISGFQNALAGKDPFGQDLPKGTPKVPVALYQLLESLVPGVNVGRRLQEHGETALPTSTVWAPKTKAGTSHGSSALDRILNPLRPVYLKGGAADLSGAAPPVKLSREDQALLREAQQEAAGATSPNEMRKLLREAELAARGG